MSTIHHIVVYGVCQMKVDIGAKEKYWRLLELIGKTGIIADEATYSKIGDKTVLQIPIEINGTIGYWSPGKIAIMRLVDVLGDETKDWIGAKVRFKHEQLDVKGVPRLVLLAEVIEKPPKN